MKSRVPSVAILKQARTNTTTQMTKFLVMISLIKLGKYHSENTQPTKLYIQSTHQLVSVKWILSFGKDK